MAQEHDHVQVAIDRRVARGDRYPGRGRVAFIEALKAEDLRAAVEARFAADFDVLADDDEHAPVLFAVSDNGPQMKVISTRQFMAQCHRLGDC